MIELPHVDLAELDADKKENIRQRREFIRTYVEWLKKTPNAVWSAQQNKMLSKPKATV